MARETKYSAATYIFKSRGLVQRHAIDRPPDSSFFLDMNSALEREEEAVSSRYGSTIINRSPGAPYANYPFTSQPVTIARLRDIYGFGHRYVGLADGSLWSRYGDYQGKFLLLLPPGSLSGNPFSTVVYTTQGSGKPVLFLYDKSALYRDTGTGIPVATGIHPPTQPIVAVQHAPDILVLEQFTSAAGFTTSNFTGIAHAVATTVAGTGGTSVLGGDYDQYTDNTGSFPNAPDGMLATSQTLADGAMRLKFNTIPLNKTYDIVALNNAYSAADTFQFHAVSGSVAASTVGTIGKTASHDLSAYQSDDLIVLALNVSNPECVQGIQVQFDVNSSNYGASYYSKSLVPVSYQGNLSLPQSNTPQSAMTEAVFDSAMGITNWGQFFGQLINPYPEVPPGLQSVQPGQLGSGQGSWMVVYLTKGSFQAVGSAGESGADWSKVTGWRVRITTSAQGSTTVKFNGLYVQGSPTGSGIGTAAGASSYGGLGYDFRYTYYDANAQVESNGCRPASFSVTDTNPGGVSTLIILRQAIDLQLRYSTNARITHLRVYVRGGTLGTNWYYADQIPNVIAGGTVHYTYILPDSAARQGNLLSLTNDVPVTSTLINPITTNLSGALSPTPANTNTPTLLTVNVDDAVTFVSNQEVIIGTQQNLEQVFVITGGTGTFTAYIFLPHAAGELVEADTVPAQPLNLACEGYGQIWMAGDTNNPNQLYYTPKGQPEYCPPQNHIPCGSPSEIITAVWNFKGTVFARTISTVYQVFPGSPPYAQTTGSKHGSPASFDWVITENEVWEQCFDGIRAFAGSIANYMSLIIEWLYRDNPQATVELVDLSQLSKVIGVFKNNTVTFSYVGQDGLRHRLRYSLSYRRWRNDDVQASAMLLEPDTNQLLMAVPYPGLGAGNYALVYEDITKDYDDGGWQSGKAVQVPIPLSLQLPYEDFGAPNNQKNINVFTIDANPNGQTLNLTLLFDDNNGSVPPINLGTFTGAIRDKFQFKINDGEGQQAYRVSPVITGAVTAAPMLYQANVEAAVLPNQRNSYDSYWSRLGLGDESGFVKQGFFDVTSNGPITIQLFANGESIPYYTVTLPANPTRYESPIRVKFPSLTVRLWRVVMTCSGTDTFQLWSPVQLDVKPLAQGKGYSRFELVEAGPA